MFIEGNLDIENLDKDSKEKIVKYFPIKGERVIYNPYGLFTGSDDKLCEVLEKEVKKEKIRYGSKIIESERTYYKLELIERKKTKSFGVREIEWLSGRIYEDIPEENIITLVELFGY